MRRVIWPLFLTLIEDEQSMEEFVIEHLPEVYHQEYQKRLRRIELLRRCEIAGICEFSFAKLKARGELCRNDWKMFPEELKDIPLDF